MGSWWMDVRFGARMLLRRPGFAAGVVLMLALGIGINAAIFSVFNGVLLRPLPYPEPDRLVQIWEENRSGGNRNTVSPLNWADWRARSESFQRMAVYGYEPFTLTGEGEARRLIGSVVSEGFFETLGVEPFLGRTFRPEEDRPGADRVVILGHSLWEGSFGADRGLLGRSITLNTEPFTVVGVMPAGFAFPNRAVELWTPVAVDLGSENRGHHFLFSIGRLERGVEPGAAQAEMDAIALQLAGDYPGTNAGSGVELVPLQEQIVGRTRPALMVLLAAVGLVLLIACANVASLLLARGSTRQKEIAVRSALGASRARLARQLLTESLLMSLVAGALGVVLARWGVDLFLWISGGGVPRAQEVGVDPVVLAFALALTVATGLLCGLAPAAQASRRAVGDSLKDAGRSGSAGPRRRRAHGALVIAEVALALLLLVGSGLLLQTFLRLRHVDPGFTTESLLTFQISLPPAKYDEPHRQAAFFREALQRLEALPTVGRVGATRGLPYVGSRSQTTFDLPGRPESPSDPPRSTDVRLASPGFFGAMGIPLLRGRLIEQGDDGDSPLVVVINQAMARRFWPGEEAVGKHLTPFYPPVDVEVVGVVGDVKQDSLHEEPVPAIYVPYEQRPHYKMSIVVRSEAPAEVLVPEIRAAVFGIDPDQPIYGIASMRERLDRSIAEQRFSAWLLTVFAVSALALAVAGVYGVLSFAVSERTREIGVRMALGAGRGDILRLVVSGGARLCAAGILIGLLAALGLTRVLSGMLFGVTATDPAVLAGTSLLLVAAGVLASLMPALRAARVQPQEALRRD